MEGLIDEPALYSRALGEDEVQAHFAAGPAGMCKQPHISNIAVFFPGTARLEVKGPPSRELQVQRSSDSTHLVPPDHDQRFHGPLPGLRCGRGHSPMAVLPGCAETPNSGTK